MPKRGRKVSRRVVWLGCHVARVSWKVLIDVPFPSSELLYVFLKLLCCSIWLSVSLDLSIVARSPMLTTFNLVQIRLCVSCSHWVPSLPG